MVAPSETDLTVQVSTWQDSIPLIPDPDHVGLNATMHTVAGADISSGIIFECTGREIIIVRKVSAGESILTVLSNACDQGFSTEHNVIAHEQAGDSTPTYKILGGFEPSRWDSSYGTLADLVTTRAKITFSGVTTGLEIMIVRVPIIGN